MSERNCVGFLDEHPHLRALADASGLIVRAEVELRDGGHPDLADLLMTAAGVCDQVRDERIGRHYKATTVPMYDPERDR